MKYLGVDFGLRKIGLAISEGEIAIPLKVIHVKSKQEGVSRLLEIIEKENIDTVVMGVPESGVRSAILKVASIIKQKVSVYLIEETLTTQNAKQEMLSLGMKRKKRKLKEDAYSASLILQEYLDSK